MKAKSSRFLELVSTLLYFDHLDKKEQIAKVHIVKNKLNFSEEEIDSAFEFIEEMQKRSAKLKKAGYLMEKLLIRRQPLLIT